MAIDTATNKTVASLLEKMVAADTDYRFMAMNDLINGLQVDTLRLDLQSEKKVVGLILRLLRDPSGEVQSLAVKSLGPLTTIVKEEQVVMIVKDLVGTMDKAGEGQLSSICSIGLKTVINALPTVNWPPVVQSAIREAVSPLLRMVTSHNDDNIRVEACEVLTEMINHFGHHLTNYHLDLLDCMLTCLGSDQTTLRKRAIQALSSLSWVIPQKYFTSLLQFVLFRLETNSSLPIKSNKSFEDDLVSLLGEHSLLQRPHLLSQLQQPANADVVKVLLQCCNAVVRHLHRIPQCFPAVLHVLISLLKKSNPNCPEQDDIHELVIQVIETLIRRCPRATVAVLPELLPLLCANLEYDPNYDYGIAEDLDDQMTVDNGDVYYEDEDDDDEYSDDEDVSWKVRRAAARALEAMVLVYSELTADFYLQVAPLLVKRFNEHEESVRLAILSCLSALLRQTRVGTIGSSNLLPSGYVPTSPGHRPIDTVNFVSSTMLEELRIQLEDSNSAQSRLVAFLPLLCKAIQTQCTQSPKRKSKSNNTNRTITSSYKHAAFMLNRDLVLALPGHLGGYIDDILAMIEDASNDPNSTNTIKMEIINVLVLLLHSHPAHYFAPKLELLVKLTLQSMDASFYRVALEGLELLQLLCVQLRSLGGGKYVNVLFELLFKILQATDRDLELKEKAITTCAMFVAQLGDLISPKLNACLDTLHRRLKNELTRLASVRAVQIIAASPLKLDLPKFLILVSEELASFLSKSDRTLRLSTLRCLYTIWCKYPNSFSESSLNTILNVIPKLLITEHDLQTTQVSLHLISLLLESGGPVADHVVQVITMDVFIGPIISLAHSPLLRGQALESMLRLMRAIGHIHKNEPGDRQQQIASLFLSHLLGPIEGIGLFGVCSANPQSLSNLHRDALPSLAQCIASLLIELPMSTNVNGTASTCALNCLNTVVDRLLTSLRVQDSSSNSSQAYLNLLILGELGRQVDLSARTDLRDMLLSCLSSTGVPHGVVSTQTSGLIITEDVKPAAALSLGRLVVGQPQILLPLLIERISQAVSQPLADQISPTGVVATGQHQLYYLIHALKEVLVNLVGQDPTDALKTHLDSMWSLLLACAGLPEEGTRNLVSECLGRLTLIAPQQLIDRLRQQLNSPQASSSYLMRCTLITAVKFILIVPDLDAATHPRHLSQPRLDLPDSFGQGSLQKTNLGIETQFSTSEVESVLRSGNPPALIDFMSRLADPEVSVRRSTLITLNTVTHHRPGMIRPLLNLPMVGSDGTRRSSILDLLYAETVVRKELIRVVEMGPFKHQEDDGLDLRKCAFECMSTLLETCLDKLIIAGFLEPLINGLTDHTDIKLLSYQMLQRIATIRPLEVAAKMEFVAAPLKAVLLSKPKEDWVKQEMEKMQELRRSAISVIISFRMIDDIDKNRHYLELLRTIESDPGLKSLYTQLLSTEQASISSIESTKTVCYTPNRV